MMTGKSSKEVKQGCHNNNNNNNNNAEEGQLLHCSMFVSSFVERTTLQLIQRRLSSQGPRENRWWMLQRVYYRPCPLVVVYCPTNSIRALREEKNMKRNKQQLTHCERSLKMTYTLTNTKCTKSTHMYLCLKMQLKQRCSYRKNTTYRHVCRFWWLSNFLGAFQLRYKASPH